MITQCIYKQYVKRIAALFAAMLLALVLFAGAQKCLAGGTPGGFYVVKTPKLTIRLSANLTSTILVTLPKGAVVQLLSVQGSYYKVAAPKGVVGYCPALSIVRAPVSLSANAARMVAMDWPSRFINTGVPYTYQACMQDMAEIDAYYANARVVTIGSSVWGNPIKALVLGRASARRKILIHGAIHAREIMTAQLTLRQAENLLEAAAQGAVFNGMKVADILDNVEIWVVPFTNPDGARLLREGTKAVPAGASVTAAALLAMNGGNPNFTQWKANGRGVDLNRNFDGNWALDPKYPKAGREGYAGSQPFSEPESVALRNLTTTMNFAYTVSYHASGEMLYWYNPYSSALNSKDRSLAYQINLLSGYVLLPTAEQVPNGGYRDWINLRMTQPAFTIEVGNMSCPLPQSQFSNIWLKNRHVVLRLAGTLFPSSLIGQIK